MEIGSTRAFAGCRSLGNGKQAQASAESDAGPNTPRAFSTPVLSRAPYSSGKLMSTPFQGTSGPSGHAGFRPAFGQPAVSRFRAAPDPLLISLQQISPEQSISHQLRRLIVRHSADAFRLGANETSDGTSNPWKRCSRVTRYDSAHLTEYSSDRSSGVVRNKGTD